MVGSLKLKPKPKLKILYKIVKEAKEKSHSIVIEPYQITMFVKLETYYLVKLRIEIIDGRSCIML